MAADPQCPRPLHLGQRGSRLAARCRRSGYRRGLLFCPALPPCIPCASGGQTLLPLRPRCTLACLMHSWLLKSFQRNTAIGVRIFFVMIVKEKGDLNFIGKIS
ncbi:uncharacterized protein [Triticum aestivum]|uniref:uncharacterized protein n=1 Tax=Triticum aestivum TaxID=4565 RepID=UPI001D014A51|nr:uncharacterized protein LOC123050421 [Triticum aestivum]